MLKKLIITIAFWCLPLTFSTSNAQVYIPPSISPEFLFENNCIVNFQTPGGMATGQMFWNGDGSQGGYMRVTGPDGSQTMLRVLYFDPLSCASV